MDFELFYEEIEGFGLVYAFEKIDNFWNLSNPVTEKLQINKKPHDSVRHQFKVF
jgi:hypothetical protein